MKIERDEARILSGVRHGLTTGAPVTLVIENRDWPNWAELMDPLAPPPAKLSPRQQRLVKDITKPRPGHGDLAGGIKWRQYDLRNVLERASARETAIRVVAGALVRQLLERFDFRFASHVIRIGSAVLDREVDRADLGSLAAKAEASEVRCIDPAASRRMIEAIKQARRKKDSLGGVVEVIVRGAPAGLGSCAQWDLRLDSRLAAALMSIPSVKAIEIGLGFEAAGRYGSEVHDEIYYDPQGDPARQCFHRTTNYAGGVEAGITNGEDIVARLAVKPISTLNRPLRTVDVVTKKPARAMVERADHCVVPAVAVIGEAMAALVLADAFMAKFGSDSLVEIERSYRAFLESPY